MYYVNVYKKHQLHVNTCMIHNRRRAPDTPDTQTAGEHLRHLREPTEEKQSRRTTADTQQQDNTDDSFLTSAPPDRAKQDNEQSKRHSDTARHTTPANKPQSHGRPTPSTPAGRTTEGRKQEERQKQRAGNPEQVCYMCTSDTVNSFILCFFASNSRKPEEKTAVFLYFRQLPQAKPPRKNI